MKGPDGNYHVFQLVERKPARVRPLVEVSDQIRNFLKLRKVTAATETLRGKTKVEAFNDRLTSITQ